MSASQTPTKSSPRCRVLPLPDHQAAVLIDGAERLRWHFGAGYPRPFFYPLTGPGRSSLTRMGHPGAPNHDHHRSVWFAHHKVLGIDFWGDQTAARIEQKHWLVYEDGDDEAVLAVLLAWRDGHDPRPLLEQELIAAVRPGPDGETLLDLQSRFVPTAETLEFGKTNFGFLAVRVAANISEHFGGGRLSDSEGRTGEPAIFGRRAAWMDYSGPAGRVQGSGFRVQETEANGAGWEGITFFDHPKNPGHPTHWHVREDGWMGASVCFAGPVTTTRENPLTLRYLLHAHRGPVDAQRAAKIQEDFAARPFYTVESGAGVKHRQFVLRRP
jgi:hypothetical protein